MNKIAQMAFICAAIASGCSTGPSAPSPQPSTLASPAITPVPTPTASPASSGPTTLGFGTLSAGTYMATPFAGDDTAPCAPVPTQQTAPPCPEATADDTIRFTFTVPDGWAGAPFQSIWLDTDGNASPDGAGMGFNRGYWLYSDPCRTPDNVASLPDIPVGPTVDDFANALADNPLLDVTAPADVTLAGFAGKYVDLQVPADISACDAYWPWEGGGGIYAQGPGHQWHLWILEVDGVRVVVQATDYAGTAPQRQAELRAIVESLQIEP